MEDTKTDAYIDRMTGLLAARIASHIKPLIREIVADVRVMAKDDLEQTLIRTLTSAVQMPLSLSPTESSQPKPPWTPSKRQRHGVECPVPGCLKYGVKTYRNFCHEHYDVIPSSERAELRRAQQFRRNPPPEVPRSSVEDTMNDSDISHTIKVADG